MNSLEKRIQDLEQKKGILEPNKEESIRIDFALLMKEYISFVEGSGGQEEYSQYMQLLEDWEKRMGTEKWKEYTKVVEQTQNSDNKPQQLSPTTIGLIAKTKQVEDAKRLKNQANAQWTERKRREKVGKK